MKLVVHVAILMGTLVGTARAGLTPEQEQVERDLREFQNSVVTGKESGSRAIGDFRMKPEDCTAAIERGKKLGLAPTQILSGNPDQYIFRRAAEKCDEYKNWQLLIQAAAALERGQSDQTVANALTPGEVTPEVAKYWSDKGVKCGTDVDDAIKKGAPTTIAVKIVDNVMTIADGRQKICKTLADWGASFSVKNQQAREAAAAALRDKYAKHGIKGGRLKVLMDNDSIYLYGAKCDHTIKDIAELKTARLLFRWTELNTGGFGVRRYELSADKLVKETYREFDRKDSAYAWCK